MKVLVSLLFFVLLPGLLLAQGRDPFGSAQKGLDTIGQKDIVGLFKNVFKINTGPSTSLEDAPKKSVYFSILPISSARTWWWQGTNNLYNSRFLCGRQANN
jgi:hypothetical protein